jgi:molecular chaperone GrpE
MAEPIEKTEQAGPAEPAGQTDPAAADQADQGSRTSAMPDRAGSPDASGNGPAHDPPEVSEPGGDIGRLGSDSGQPAQLETAETETTETVELAETVDAALAAERLVDLQRLQAEYVNYKRRVERDRSLAGDLAAGRVIESLLPVLDDIYLAQQHGDLEGSPFASIADKLDATLAKQGVERYGQPGEAFDPAQHEALMHTEAELAEGTSGTTVVQILQPGYRMGERVLRPARVAVADPK